MKSGRRHIQVWADWAELPGRQRMGDLVVQMTRGKEIFSFEYDGTWLKEGPTLALDPSLQHFRGPQYPDAERPNFGLFLDSSPDRWGRVLMDRREAVVTRKAGRPPRPLLGVDYLLGVHDPQRLGGLRFRIGEGPFLDDDHERAAGAAEGPATRSTAAPARRRACWAALVSEPGSARLARASDCASRSLGSHSSAARNSRGKSK